MKDKEYAKWLATEAYNAPQELRHLSRPNYRPLLIEAQIQAYKQAMTPPSHKIPLKLRRKYQGKRRTPPLRAVIHRANEVKATNAMNMRIIELLEKEKSKQ